MDSRTNPARVVGKLRNWQRNGNAIDGLLYGHPKYPNGHDHTSADVKFFFTRSARRFVRCRSCTYELDGPGDEAGERFFAEKLQSLDDRQDRGHQW